MAVPDIQTGDIKFSLYSGDLARERNYRVFPSRFVGSRWNYRSGRCKDAGRQTRPGRVKSLPVDHLKRHQVQVNRVAVHGCVEDFPDLRAVKEGGLGNGVAECFRRGGQLSRAIGCHHSQQGLARCHGFREIARNSRGEGRTVRLEIQVAGGNAKQRTDNGSVVNVNFHTYLVGGHFVERDLARACRSAESRLGGKNQTYRRRCG